VPNLSNADFVYVKGDKLGKSLENTGWFPEIEQVAVGDELLMKYRCAVLMTRWLLHAQPLLCVLHVCHKPEG
jgi:hypothetical protein